MYLRFFFSKIIKLLPCLKVHFSFFSDDDHEKDDDDEGEMEDETLVSFFHECYMYSIIVCFCSFLPLVQHILLQKNSACFFLSLHVRLSCRKKIGEKEHWWW